jgi:hypothetical protein
MNAPTAQYFMPESIELLVEEDKDPRHQKVKDDALGLGWVCGLRYMSVR